MESNNSEASKQKQGRQMAFFEFLQQNNLSIGIIISSVLFPLMLEGVKRRWDRANEDRQKRIDETREKQTMTLKKKTEVLDSLTRVFVTYCIEARFLTTDANLDRLDTKLGQDHRKSYDENAKIYFRDIEILSLQTEQYFDRGSIYASHFRDLQIPLIDKAITSITEALPNANNQNESPNPRWEYIDSVLSEIDPIIKEILKQMALEIRPEYKNEPITWRYKLNPTKLEYALNGLPPEQPTR